MNRDKPDKPDDFGYDFEGGDVSALTHSLANRLEFSVGKDSQTATPHDWLNVASYVVRDRLMERWIETHRSYYEQDVKRVYYLSLEFLMGRALSNSMLSLGMHDEIEQSLHDVGVDMEEIQELEPDAGLGNGGLGRLAACFLDSLSTLQIPGYGYGIRYEYGMFAQRIENGWQVEHPDNWLRYGNPWEFPRAELLYPVKFGGQVIQVCDEKGCMRHHWVDTDEVMAMACDTPIPGYKNDTVNNLRLWAAKASRDFNLKYFNEGNYIKAVEEKNESENLSKVLYPDDTTEMGQELRLKQQYFFVSASLQDILYRHCKNHEGFTGLEDKVAIQLNDTHPAIAIPEFMRIMMDIYAMGWDEAWSMSSKIFSYTNHTLLPEALETWPIELFESVLPRHLQIIYEINQRFLNDVIHRYPGDVDKMKRMSIINEDGERSVRMANLAVVGSHKVNGVSAIHTDLMRQTIFNEFDEFFPDKIINITNGVTPRRWLNQANPELAKLISGKIDGEWLTRLDRLKELLPYADDEDFRREFIRVKLENKRELASLIHMNLGVNIDPASMFDVQVKRLHEYKRQLLNVLHVITRYNMIRRGETSELAPRTVIFSGKAAPGYAMAKLIIKLINDVADIINNDPAVYGLLRVVYIPNYDVSTAEDIIPAADLSEQISLAGMEASGTGNMKLALNGAITIGTQDGANIEIAEAVGEENIFTFGMDAAEVGEHWRRGYNPVDYYNEDERLREVIDMIGSGYFCSDDIKRFKPVADMLLGHDQYMVCADYADYMRAQLEADALYNDQHAWARKAIINVAMMGRFSSDKTILEYVEKVWNVSQINKSPD